MLIILWSSRLLEIKKTFLFTQLKSRKSKKTKRRECMWIKKKLGDFKYYALCIFLSLIIKSHSINLADGTI